MRFEITNTIGDFQQHEVVDPKRAEETLRQYANLIERGATFPVEQLKVVAIDE